MTATACGRGDSGVPVVAEGLVAMLRLLCVLVLVLVLAATGLTARLRPLTVVELVLLMEGMERVRGAMGAKTSEAMGASGVTGLTVPGGSVGEVDGGGAAVRGDSSAPELELVEMECARGAAIDVVCVRGLGAAGEAEGNRGDMKAPVVWLLLLSLSSTSSTSSSISGAVCILCTKYDVSINYGKKREGRKCTFGCMHTYMHIQLSPMSKRSRQYDY